MNRTNVIEDLSLLPLPPWWLNPWFVAAVVLALAAIAGTVSVLVRRFRARPRPVPRRPVGPPPHDEFLRRLADLRARRESLDAHALGIEASGILRGYIEAWFRFPVLFQTTREFLVHVAGRDELQARQREALAGFLAACDGLKFARHDATHAEREALLDTAERFVRECAGLVPVPQA